MLINSGMILPKTQAMGAKVVAERIRATVKQSAIGMGTVRPNCTASVGGLTIKTHDTRTDHVEVWNTLQQLLKPKNPEEIESFGKRCPTTYKTSRVYLTRRG